MPARCVSNETPATASDDISHNIIAEVPQLIGFSYWVETAGSASAGAFNMDITWLDFIGQSRILNGSPISLQDPNASFSSPVAVVRRQTDTSQFDIVKTLIGLAGGAVIGYAIYITPGSSSDVGVF